VASWHLRDVTRRLPIGGLQLADCSWAPSFVCETRSLS
jgi:hypothetical protein